MFVIFDMRAVFGFCPAVLFSIKAARFHTDRISSRLPRRHVRAVSTLTAAHHTDALSRTSPNALAMAGTYRSSGLYAPGCQLGLKAPRHCGLSLAAASGLLPQKRILRLEFFWLVAELRDCSGLISEIGRIVIARG